MPSRPRQSPRLPFCVSRTRAPTSVFDRCDFRPRHLRAMTGSGKRLPYEATADEFHRHAASLPLDLDTGSGLADDVIAYADGIDVDLVSEPYLIHEHAGAVLK